jgi:SAM-dependent methyltransferase
VACAAAVGDGWTCPSCGFAPARRGDVLCFAPERAAAGNGFDPASFRLLAELESDSFWFRARSRLILWALERYFPAAEALLEVGCGTGFVLAGIRDARPRMRLAGADLYVEGLEHARRRVADAAWYQLDATNVPFESEWDVVAAFDVLEHIPEDEDVLASLHRAVRPGGGLLVTVPQHPWLWSRADDYAHHVRRYRHRELQSKIARAGFRIERSTSFVSALLPAMWLSRLRDRRAGDRYDPAREHAVSRLSGVLEAVLDVERTAIERGISLPAGGSLLVVATHP